MPLFLLFLILLISSPCFSQSLNGQPVPGNSRPAGEEFQSSDQVWEVGDRRWTVEEEHRFEKWVDETITEDFFIHYRIPADCADAVYAIRWIYARIAHLPAAATTTDGKLIGHWSTDWKHLPTDPEWHKDERFRACLLYALHKTWTGTLPLDTYPVRVSADSVRPGTLFLIRESHAGMIGHVFLDGSQAHPLQTWESALPVKVQKLSLGYFFSAKPESKARSGLVRFRWPVSENGEWKYLPVEKHPFYSEEQYAPGFCNGYADFVEAVAKRIDPTHYSPAEKMAKVMETVTRFLRERVPIVLAGYQQCRDGGCPEASEFWEIYNTSGRDAMIISLMDHLSQLIESNHLDREMVKGMMEPIPITITENRSVTLYHVYQNHIWFSPHPEDSIEARWGLKKCEMIHAQTRTTQHSIAFIERTYRKKDPKYADFSILRQQQLLGRLNEEWTKSGCGEFPPAPVESAWFSSRPADSIKAQRGLRKCEMIRAEIRSTKDSVAFIERIYRKKDPDYASFSVQQQQLLLGRLNEEWTKSGCEKAPPTAVREARLSPHPADSIKPGRTSKKCEMIRAEIRSANDSVAFIERAYRKKDPEYADFSIQQQQQDLRRLTEEWTGSGCAEPPPAPEKKAGK
ncbi:MAG TPA: hypothetical protein VEM15_06710 [Thermodesulfobacteriota bacterium]|nr:hypothetical protein [Thermodesulfobacteriota bacterium]